MLELICWGFTHFMLLSGDGYGYLWFRRNSLCWWWPDWNWQVVGRRHFHVYSIWVRLSMFIWLAHPVHTWAGFLDDFNVLSNLACKCNLLTNLVKPVIDVPGRFQVRDRTSKSFQFAKLQIYNFFFMMLLIGHGMRSYVYQSFILNFIKV